ncbi:MAG TPA: Ig-like domain-containing protein, partial [Chloroflexota bacterium]|nr:Ig-like domain-containing protein [Chloroflexota bacterium]
LAVLLFTLLILTACDSGQPTETVVQVIEVTATPPPTAVPTFTPTALPDHLAVTLPGNLDAFPPGDALVLHFNQPMNTSLSQPLTFSPRVNGTAVWSNNNTTLTFTPDDGFNSNRSYNITLSADLHSASGLAFAGTQRWQMKTLTAPFVAGRTPSRTTITDRLPT